MAVAVSLTLLAAPARSQQTPSFGASREVVRIDVVVVDPSGAPVRGLTAADFQIFEKRRPLPITSFEAVVPAPPPVAGADADAADKARDVSAPAPAEPEQGRAFLVLFDDVNLGEAAAARVRGGLEKLLADGLVDGDLVSLHTTSGLRFTARTPAERQQMRQIVSTLVASRRAEVVMGKKGFGTGMSDYEAMQTTRIADPGGDAGVLNMALAQQVYAQARQRAMAGLSAMAHALVALEGFRGRKSLIVYSEGYLKLPDTPQYDQVIELARRTRVSIYFSDAFGLQGDGTRAEGRLPGQADVRHLHRMQEEGAGSAYVAFGTGGRAATVNDQTLLFREAATRASAYYLLGFEPPEGKQGERKVDIRVRKGLKVVASDRYFLAPPVGPPDAPTAFRAAMASVFDSGDVPFTVATGTRDGVSSTTFTVSLPRDAAAPERTLDLRIEARPLDAGAPVRDAAELTVPRGSVPARLRRDLPLRPGRWQARVAVRDRDTGLVGSLLHTFEVKGAAAAAP
jgi:VWFA-related protein